MARNSPFDAKIAHFIATHRNEDVQKLAFSSKKYPDVDMPVAIQQIAGWQQARQKTPSWAAVDGIVYPPHLNMEQCSSEQAARFKAQLVKGETLVDLTGGFGVDCYFMSQGFVHTDYVECDASLAALVAENFTHRADITIHVADSTDYLNRMGAVDCVMLDPSRRSATGHKVAALSDCSPNVLELRDLLLRKAQRVVLKLSPMLDVCQAVRALGPSVTDVYVLAIDGECREMLMLMGGASDVVMLHGVHLHHGVTDCFTYTQAEEEACPLKVADAVLSYLYEPNAALMKLGAFRLLTKRYDLRMLHANSHLYTADELISDFPGRVMRVRRCVGMGKREQRDLSSLGRANVCTRNFPMSSDALRRRLRLLDGGDVFVYGTTLHDGRHVVLVCDRV